MPVKRRHDKRRAAIPEVIIGFFRDEPIGDDEESRSALIDLRHFDSPAPIAELWDACRDEILAEWVREHPGTRPSHWWRFDAPRSPIGTYPGCFYDGTLPEMRQRLGGAGTLRSDALAYHPVFAMGLPLDWVRAADLETWPSLRGRAQPIDANDPPVFESQAAYLERHGLLVPGERKRLRDEDFAPESVATESDEG